MTLRPLTAWDVSEGGPVRAAFEAMAVQWPRQQRQGLYDIIASATFPEKIWMVCGLCKTAQRIHEVVYLSMNSL